MADISDARRVARRFGWEPLSVDPISSGHINQSFSVSTPERAYVLQRINRSVFSDVAGMTANILAVQRHLRGELVPEPVRALRGDWLVDDGGETWRAFVRVPDAAPVVEVDPSTARSAGQLLGRFHARLADLDPAELVESMPGFHAPRRRLQALREVVDRDPHRRVASVEPEIGMAFAAASLIDVAERVERSVPRRVAHNDAKLDNILFRGGEAVCLVDLDTVMPGAWFWDVGDLLRTASTIAAEDCPDATRAVVDASLYDAVVAGYRHGVSTGPVTASELAAVDVAGAIVTYEQAVRFLTDWIAGDVYYRTVRPRQNRDRARAQFRLLASMPGAVFSS